MDTNWELKREIHGRGLRQSFIASRLGIAEDRFSRIIHGRINPTPDEQRAITKFLGRDVFAGVDGGAVTEDSHAERR